MADDAAKNEGAPDGTGASKLNTEAIERLKADLRSLRSDLEAAARTVNQLGSTAAQEAVNQAHAQMEQVRARLEEFLDDAQDYGDHSLETVRQHVQERPFASLLMAVAAGFILAHLFGRR